MSRFTQIVYVFGNPQCIAESVCWESEGSVSKTLRILLANPEVPNFVYPTCLLGRQKSWGNFPKKKYF
jgi:hypothetical protein